MKRPFCEVPGCQFNNPVVPYEPDRLVLLAGKESEERVVLRHRYDCPRGSNDKVDVWVCDDCQNAGDAETRVRRAIEARLGQKEMM